MISPTISIITVCLNSKQTIRQTFDSLLRQTSKNFEYILIDGGSNDGTLEIIKEYQKKFTASDIQFRWMSGPDLGIYDAMNKGINLATGDFIGLLNSDDFYELDTLETIKVAAVSNPDVDIFYGLLRVLMSNGEELQIYRYNYENYLAKIGSGCESGAQHPTCFVKNSLYERIGNFDMQFRTSADYDFLLRAKLSSAKFKGLDKVLTNFGSDGLSGKIDNFDRIDQRYSIHLKHKLISLNEYNEFLKYKRLQKYFKIKNRIGSIIFGKLK